MNKKRSLFHRSRWLTASRRPLQAERLERRDLLTLVILTDPLPNSFDADVTSDVTATFVEEIPLPGETPLPVDISSPSATLENIAVHTARGRLLLNPTEATVDTTANVVTVDPEHDFFAGELVQVTVTAGVKDTNNDSVDPYVWQFRTEVTGGSGTFSDAGEISGNSAEGFSLGDVDGDGHIDAFVVYDGSLRKHRGKWIPGEPNRVWFNNGDGTFTKGEQDLGLDRSVAVELGDLNGDGALDVFIANDEEGHRVWLNANDGTRRFIDSPQVLGNDPASFQIELADIDSDGDLDAIVRGSDSLRIWTNDGTGNFSDSGALALVGAGTVAIADVDLDGDLDLFASVKGGPNQIWLNDGGGQFPDRGQRLDDMGDNWTMDVQLADLDGNGYADAFVVNNQVDGSRVWLNHGGVFSEEKSLGDGLYSQGVALGDVDADGDLDAFVTNWFEGDGVWLNDGAGNFNDSGQRLGNIEGSRPVELADLDGDGDLDSVVMPNSRPEFRVWYNDDVPPPGGQKLHVGDLDAETSRGRGGKWSAAFEITVHDDADAPFESALVTGTLSGGASGSFSCTTDVAGLCTVTKNNISKSSSSAVFTVVDVDLSGATYAPGSNHDSDGDSNGTSITVQNPSSAGSTQFGQLVFAVPDSELSDAGLADAGSSVEESTPQPAVESLSSQSLDGEAVDAALIDFERSSGDVGADDDEFADLLVAVGELLD